VESLRKGGLHLKSRRAQAVPAISQKLNISSENINEPRIIPSEKAEKPLSSLHRNDSYKLAHSFELTAVLINKEPPLFNGPIKERNMQVSSNNDNTDLVHIRSYL
jgi:hypothetical protein